MCSDRSSPRATDDMDLGTPPHSPKSKMTRGAAKVMDYDNAKEINGTAVERVQGFVNIEERAAERGTEKLTEIERKNLAKSRVAQLQEKIKTGIDKLTNSGIQQKTGLYQPPHQRSAAAAAIFAVEDEDVNSEKSTGEKTTNGKSKNRYGVLVFGVCLDQGSKSF